MNQFEDIEEFRYIKTARRLLKPITCRLESLTKNEDFSDELRFESIISLGMIGDISSIPILMNAFERFPDYLEPITALGHLKSSTPVAKLIERLQLLN